MSLEGISKNNSTKNNCHFNQKVEQPGHFNGKVVTVTTQLHPDLISEIAKKIGFSQISSLMLASRDYHHASIKTLSPGEIFARLMVFNEKDRHVAECIVSCLPEPTAQLIKLTQRLIERDKLRDFGRLCKDLKVSIQDLKNFKDFLSIMKRDILDKKIINKDFRLDKARIFLKCFKIKPETEKVFFDFLTDLLKHVSSSKINPSQAEFLALLLTQALRQGSREELKKFVTSVSVRTFLILFLDKLTRNSANDILKSKGGAANKIFDLSFEIMAEKYPSLVQPDTSYKIRLESLMELLETLNQDPEAFNQVYYMFLFFENCVPCRLEVRILVQLTCRYRDSKTSVETLVSFVEKDFPLPKFYNSRERPTHYFPQILGEEKYLAFIQETERQRLLKETSV